MSQNQEIIESKLCGYIDGELDPEGRAEIEKHLEANPQHRRLLESLRATRDLIRWLPREPAPPEVAETLSGQLERSVLLNYESDSLGTNVWPRILAAAAILLLTAGLGVAVYYALPRSQKPQLALHSTGLEANTGDVVPAPDANPAGASAATDVARTKNGELNQNSTELEQLAEQVALNPGAFLGSTENANHAVTQNAAAPNSNAVVLVVRSDAPDQTEQQLTRYFTQQQIQWRQPAMGRRTELAIQTQQSALPDQSTSGEKNSPTVQNGAVPNEPPLGPALSSVAATAPARNEAFGVSDAPANTGQQQVTAGQARRARANSIYVCQMSRRQAEQLTSTIGNGAVTGNQAQNFNASLYSNSLASGMSENGVFGQQTAADPASQGGFAGQAGVRGRMMKAVPQTQPATTLREALQASVQPSAPTSRQAIEAAPVPNFGLGAIGPEAAFTKIPQSQPASAPAEQAQSAPMAAASQPAQGAVATTGPADEPLNVVIVVQPNSAFEAVPTSSPSSTQPAQASDPLQAPVVPPPQSTRQ